MKYPYAGLALAAVASAQGVGKPLYPQGVNGPPTKGTNFPKNAFVLGTQPTSDNSKTNGVYNCSSSEYAGAPRISLTGSALTDERGSTGSIVANDQFQFDGPPQQGVKVSAGWVRTEDGRLSLGGNTKFFNCLSGDFSNIYAATQGEQCKEVYLTLQTCTSCSKGAVRYDTVDKSAQGTERFIIPQVSNNDNIADNPNVSSPQLGSTVGGDYKDAVCSGQSSVSSAPSSTAAPSSSAAAPSSAAASSAAPFSSAAPSTTAAPQVSVAPPPMVMLPPQTQVAVAPVSNSTATMSTATAPKSSTTAAAPSSSPSPFTNAAPAIAVGQKAIALLAVVAAAFALA